MPEIMVQADHIGKKYIITHHTHRNYTTLRDVLVDKAKTLTRSFIRPSNYHKNGSFKEELWALKDISFDIKQGECVGIIGPNGAGKSTLLKILSRITEPTTGRMKINGLVGSLLEVGTGFHPELTGRENIFLNGAILGMPNKDIKKKFDEIVSFAEIEKFLDTPVKRYSSGMYVRLAFAVAAHLEPEILLIDEVLAVGDLAFQKKCLGKMDAIAKEGRTVLFVSHNMGAIRNLCEHAFWIEAGRIKETGSAQEILRRYEKKQIKSYDPIHSIAIRDPKEVKRSDFYFCRVEMQNTQGENSSIFKFQDNLVLLAELSGIPETAPYSIEFRIYKETGEFVCVGSSGTFHGISFERNTKKIRIKIGPLILTNGKYNISLNTVMRNEKSDIWSNACSFHIIECHPFALKYEIKNPVCVVMHEFSALD